MIKAIKLTPHDANVHLKLSDVLSQGSIILGFPSQSDDQVSCAYTYAFYQVMHDSYIVTIDIHACMQVKKNADNIRKVLSSQTTPDTTQVSALVCVCMILAFNWHIAGRRSVTDAR